MIFLFEIESVKTSRPVLRPRGKAYVGDEIAAKAERVCMMGNI